MTFVSLSDTAIAELERATLDAVSPVAVEELPGWLLPLDAGTIGRAKSAVPLRHADFDQPAAMLDQLEARYAAHHLPAAFRVADVLGLAPLHAELARRGYTADQPTLTQVGSAMRMRQVCGSTRAQVSTRPVQAWSSVFLAPGFDPVDGAHRIQALSRGKDAVYASVTDGASGAPVAAGTAAFGHGWASVHGMRTALSHRGLGLAGQILAGLAEAALARGLDRVFLQVEEGNEGALALYRRAGFGTAWRYHYWRRLPAS
jgi:GNAT superfamily N-acetyltransferase